MPKMIIATQHQYYFSFILWVLFGQSALLSRIPKSSVNIDVTRIGLDRHPYVVFRVFYCVSEKFITLQSASTVATFATFVLLGLLVLGP